MNDEMNKTLKALRVRDLCKGSLYAKPEDVRATHLWAIERMDGPEARAEEEALLDYGNEQFDAGYRLRYGDRTTVPYVVTAPDEALASRIIRAGFIGTARAFRLIWVERV